MDIDKYGEVDDGGLSDSEGILIRNTMVYDYSKTCRPKQQQAVLPLCAFEPANANEVAVLISLFKQTQWQFAVKSSGHGMAASHTHIVPSIFAS
ncbi:hypothetical protein B0T14DRAFT_565833 [Immersiella caudata]|uniref:FAD linked oxidase N-terminal domain-containing protein n=1 Tax=Immersiella caudata TaxID=314043 RepID=A0AA39WP13_9PEZI|nr:hypothetical protein B0T14DRAFT_565833 [Immersiella caudata]